MERWIWAVVLMKEKKKSIVFNDDVLSYNAKPNIHVQYFLRSTVEGGISKHLNKCYQIHESHVTVRSLVKCSSNQYATTG